MPKTKQDDVKLLFAEDSDSLGYNQKYGTTENNDVINNKDAVTSEAEGTIRSRSIRLIQTVCMLGIYIGLVRIEFFGFDQAAFMVCFSCDRASTWVWQTRV